MLVEQCPPLGLTVEMLGPAERNKITNDPKVVAEVKYLPPYKLSTKHGRFQSTTIIDLLFFLLILYMACKDDVKLHQPQLIHGGIL